ncbi:class I SAM-dependent methyltransferase, partial [Sansalvadorimonas verongulae]|uniref:hypothetical protein n=1 Tax=Sansalvadorimonas verongulae TaxID=2172824 RepID=UPI0012BD133E
MESIAAKSQSTLSTGGTPQTTSSAAVKPTATTCTTTACKKGRLTGNTESSALPELPVKKRKVKKVSDAYVIEELRERITDTVELFRAASPSANHQLFHQYLSDLQTTLEAYESQTIPEKAVNDSLIEDIFPAKEDRHLKSCLYELSDKLFEIRRKRSFVNLDSCFIHKLAEHLQQSPCLEIFAGNGWLTDELVKSGANVTATDDYSWYDTDYMSREFVRSVQEKPAYEAASDFSEATMSEPEATILFGFPIHDDPSSKLDEIFQVILPRHPNMRIISIDANLPEWQAPQNAVVTDLTERL